MANHPPVPAIHAAYQHRLALALRSPKHETILAPEIGLELVQSTYDAVTLAALIDPASTVVRKAAHGGSASDTAGGLLEVLCDIMIGRPVQECADHAAIYLEHRLRDPSCPRPVPGIITPDNADPAFHMSIRLIRALAREYFQVMRRSDTENFFDPPASASWCALSQRERHRRVQAALTGICAALGLSETELSLLGVGDDNRVFLEFTRTGSSDEKGRLLMQVEAHLKATVEEQLHVYTTERRDMNKIRRLAALDVEQPIATHPGRPGIDLIHD